MSSDIVGRTSARYERRWCSDDAIIYALSVGAGSDDPTAELHYTTEGGIGYQQAALTGFASVLGKPHPDAYRLLGDVERSAVLQSGYELEWLAPTPLPVEGLLWATTSVAEAFAHRSGCFVTLESRCAYDGSDDCAFVTRSKVFVRGLVIDDTAPRPKRPERPIGEPDLILTVQTGAQQALLHRLLGDRNPLHYDPAVAASAGFARPILHGLCTFGIAARVLGRLRHMSARFVAPVFPGEELIVSAWRDSDEAYGYSMTGSDGRLVLDDGRVTRPVEN